MKIDWVRVPISPGPMLLPHTHTMEALVYRKWANPKSIHRDQPNNLNIIKHTIWLFPATPSSQKSTKRYNG